MLEEENARVCLPFGKEHILIVSLFIYLLSLFFILFVLFWSGLAPAALSA